MGHKEAAPVRAASNLELPLLFHHRERSPERSRPKILVDSGEWKIPSRLSTGRRESKSPANRLHRSRRNETTGNFSTSNGPLKVTAHRELTRRARRYLRRMRGLPWG